MQSAALERPCPALYHEYLEPQFADLTALASVPLLSCHRRRWHRLGLRWFWLRLRRFGHCLGHPSWDNRRRLGLAGPYLCHSRWRCLHRPLRTLVESKQNLFRTLQTQNQNGPLNNLLRNIIGSLQVAFPFAPNPKPPFCSP